MWHIRDIAKDFISIEFLIAHDVLTVKSVHDILTFTNRSSEIVAYRIFRRYVI